MAGPGAEVDAGFEFAFDNEAFSDKVLRLEVVGSDDAPGSGTDAASCKRRREEAEGDDGEEENTFMELLRFMYSGKLSPTTEATLLVDIMMASEKFEVVSCMRLCRQQLRNLPVIPESAVTSLDLPCSNSVAAELTEAAKIFLAKRYEDFLSTEFEDELMRIPLAGIEAILSKNDLGLVSEEAVYDFVHWWACSRYPNPKERRKILRSRLVPLVPIIFY